MTLGGAEQRLDAGELRQWPAGGLERVAADFGEFSACPVELGVKGLRLNLGGEQGLRLPECSGRLAPWSAGN